MIAIKELRIGNYVLLDGLIPDKENDGEHYNPLDHAEIWGTDFTGRAEVSWDIPYKCNACMWQDEEQLLPIPVTAEWLEAFGFSFIGGLWYKGVRLSVKTVVWLSSFNSLQIDSPFGHINLTSVHQLQNWFFALTGQELEIKEIT